MQGKGKPRVLVVDDERVIADTLSIILNQNGFDASAIYTGQDAIDRACSTRLRPHAEQHAPHVGMRNDRT